MAKIFFIELPVADKMRYICQLTEKYYLAGKRVLIHVKDKQEAARLDKVLWNWKEDTFIPHLISSDPHLQPDEPVLISDNCQHNNALSALILNDAVETDKFFGYEHVIDFAETHDPQKRQESRNRYKTATENADQTVTFIKLADFLQSSLE